MDSTELVNSSVASFAEMLASPAPIPGGGCACALVGALGVALGDMVGGHTVDKTKDAATEAYMRAYMEEAQDLRNRLLACVEKDARAFEPLSQAYAIPREDPRRDEILEQCLRNAAAVPLEMVDLVCEAIELLQDFAKKGRKLILSDAATGISFCRAALLGAAVNVKVNTHLMKDRVYAARIDTHVERAVRTHTKLAERVYKDIFRQYC